MPTIAHVTNYLRVRKKGDHAMIMICFMAFFWCVFDGIMGYMVPISITSNGYSESTMGLIFGSSSVAGMIFDFILCRYLRHANYRRMYLLMFGLCILFPLLMWQPSILLIYLLAMTVWGMYYDLFNMGNLAFISQNTEKKTFSSHFGILLAFITLGAVLSPMISSYLLSQTSHDMPFLAALGFLLIAFIFFSLAIIVSRRKKKEVLIKYEPTNVWIELKAWKKIGHYLLPVLFFTLYLNIINAFYWVIGPLLSERLNMDGENGLFLMAYLFPPLIVGWIVGRITNRLGKKHTAFLALILGSAVMTSFVVISNPLVLVAVNFVAAFFIAMAWPSINGVYADYISERPDLDTEIETVQDTFTNLGYVIGPVFAGFAAQYLGYTQSFALAGVIGVVVGIALLVITPKHIRIR